MTRCGRGCGVLLSVMLLLTGSATGCRGGAGTQPKDDQRASGDPTRLEPVALPDVSSTAPAVQKQIHDAAGSAESYAQRGEHDNAGAAYGQLGKVLLAAGYPDAAVTALRRAIASSPSDVRWHHFLGYAYWRTNRPDQAIASFERATALAPGGDLSALLWLGELHLTRWESARAETAFRKARMLQGSSAPAEAGLGRVALARRDYSSAVEHLERALMLDPRLLSAHYPLALAYRALGNTRQAELHFRVGPTAETAGFDQRLQELEGLVESAPERDAQGRSALARGDWPAAVAHFRRGLELTGSDASLRATLHHRLGTALAQLNDGAGAYAEFQRAIEVVPGFAPAHYSLGLTSLAANDANAAIRHLSNAIRHDPSYLEAHIALGDVQRLLGQSEDALRHYRRALDISPASAAARFGEGVSLAKLHRFLEARDRFTEANALYPSDPSLALGLARVLAASPDEHVRDVQRAQALVAPIAAGSPTADALEVLAMARAASGAYEEAARIQRDAMTLAGRTGQGDRARRMAENLRSYEGRRQPRTLWTAEPLYQRSMR